MLAITHLDSYSVIFCLLKLKVCIDGWRSSKMSLILGWMSFCLTKHHHRNEIGVDDQLAAKPAVMLLLLGNSKLTEFNLLKGSL